MLGLLLLLLLLFCFVCGGFFELAVEYPCLNQREIKKGRALSAQLCLCIVHWGEIFHHMPHSQFFEGALISPSSPLDIF